MRKKIPYYKMTKLHNPFVSGNNKKVIENYIYVDYEGELYSYWNAPEHLRENKYDNKN